MQGGAARRKVAWRRECREATWHLIGFCRGALRHTFLRHTLLVSRKHTPTPHSPQTLQQGRGCAEIKPNYAGGGSSGERSGEGGGGRVGWGRWLCGVWGVCGVLCLMIDCDNQFLDWTFTKSTLHAEAFIFMPKVACTRPEAVGHPISRLWRPGCFLEYSVFALHGGAQPCVTWGISGGSEPKAHEKANLHVRPWSLGFALSPHWFGLVNQIDFKLRPQPERNAAVHPIACGNQSRL